MSKHLHDLLAALMLLSFDDSLGLDEESGDGVISPALDSQSAKASATSVQQCFRKELDSLVKRSYPPLIVRELLVLQGGPGRRVRLRPWTCCLCYPTVWQS